MSGQQKARAEPIGHVRESADEYNRLNARKYKLKPIKRPPEPHPVDADFGRRTAHEYESLPSGPPRDKASRASYDAFARETKEQYDFAVSRGYTFEPSEDDPYSEQGRSKMDQVREDVRERKRLKAYASALDHPHLSNDTNLQFRFVHDLFGHTQEGNSIGPRGEFNAAASHSQMYSRKARPAMLAETHGQNSVVNFSLTPSKEHGGRPIAEVNREKPGSYYAEQKATILPRHIVREFEARVEGRGLWGRMLGRKRG